MAESPIDTNIIPGSEKLNNSPTPNPTTEFAFGLLTALTEPDRTTTRPSEWTHSEDLPEASKPIDILIAKIRLLRPEDVAPAIDAAIVFISQVNVWGQHVIGSLKRELSENEQEALLHLRRIAAEEEAEDLTNEEKKLRELYLESNKLQTPKSPA